MAKVRVVTDSAAELEPEVADALGIVVVPMGIRFGDEEFRDGVDITPEHFHRRLEYSPVMPVAAPPSFRSFQEAYRDLSESTDRIISIHVSDRLSRTYNVANAAAEAFLGRCQPVWSPVGRYPAERRTETASPRRRWAALTGSSPPPATRCPVRGRSTYRTS